jgi:AAA domain
MKTPDANEIARTHGKDALRVAIDTGWSANGHAELPVDDENAPRLVLTLPEFLAKFEAPDYLVDGLLQRHFLYSLTGMTGAGKTAVASLLAFLMSRRTPGQTFGPHAVEHGRVVYIAAENPLDVQMRFLALLSKFQLGMDDLDLLVIDNVGDLDKAYARIERDVRAFGPVDLVIVDTSAAVFPGNDENSNAQMREHAKRLRRLTELPGKPCTLALCHPVKNASAQDALLPRGGGAFVAEVDGNLTLWAHDGYLADLHWTGKFRGPDFAPITFRTDTAYPPALVDKRGRPLPTVVASFVTPAQAEVAQAGAVKQEDALLAAMKDNPRGSLATWAAACGWLINGSLARPNKQLASRVANRLKKDKLVAKVGRDFVLTRAGRKQAGNALETAA